jgi:hypothetical protein
MKKSSAHLSVLPLLSILLLMLNGACTPPVEKIQLSAPSNVDMVVLSNGIDSVGLLKTEEGWTLPGGEELSAVAVENLLFTAARLQISSIVSEPPQGAVDHRRISYYQGRKLLLSYTLQTVAGSYLLHPPGEQSYYVTLPGYPELNLMRVFSANANHFREHLLIALLPAEIASIELELASGEAFRFIQDADGTIRCETANALTNLPGDEPDDLAGRLLFSYFSSIMHEGKSRILADTLHSPEFVKDKLATIRVRSFAGEEHVLEVFPYREMPASLPHMFRALVLHNQEQEAYFINYIYLDVLMRGLSHYFTP